MRLIDKNALLEKIDQNAYLVRYDFEFTSIEKGMTITGILQALDDVPIVDSLQIDRVLEIIDDADKKAGDKTYIVLDDGFFCSQARYIKEKMLELLEE